MKKFLAYLVVALFLSAFTFVSPSHGDSPVKKPTAEIVGFTHDVVNAIPPVLASDWRTELVALLQSSCDATDRKAIMEEYGKPLTEELKAFLVSENEFRPVANVTYLFGEGFADKVASGTPIAYSGYFRDQLLARMTFTDGASKLIFIKCFNGLFSIMEPEKLEVVMEVTVYAPSRVVQKT